MRLGLLNTRTLALTEGLHGQVDRCRLAGSIVIEDIQIAATTITRHYLAHWTRFIRQFKTGINLTTAGIIVSRNDHCAGAIVDQLALIVEAIGGRTALTITTTNHHAFRTSPGRLCRYDDGAHNQSKAHKAGRR